LQIEVRAIEGSPLALEDQSGGGGADIRMGWSTV
jgi:hypothetical protein